MYSKRLFKYNYLNNLFIKHKNLNLLHHASIIMARCCAPIAHSYQASICGSMLCIWHQYGCASCIMAQCCALCINHDGSILLNHQYGSVLCIRHQLWLNHVHHGSLRAVHPRLIDVHQTSVWLNAVHQVSISLIAQCCVPGINVVVHHASIWLDAVQPRLNDVQQTSLWFKAVYQASIWLNMQGRN